MKGIKIYDQIYDVIGGECYCGGPILECTETCCPSDSDDYCPKSEVQQIKSILTKYDHMKRKEVKYNGITKELLERTTRRILHNPRQYK